MSLPRRNDLRALPASQRAVNIIGYEIRPEAETAAAQNAYLHTLANAQSGDELPTAPSSTRAIFTDASGELFTVHESEDGPVTLPATMPPRLRNEAAHAGGFINAQDVHEMRGGLTKLYTADRALYSAAAEASAKHPSLVAQATAGLLKSAMSEGLKALTTGLAGEGNVLDGIKNCFPNGKAGDLLSAANLASGAGMLTGQIAGMAFGALNDALFGGINDESSTGAQLGAFAGQKLMGELEGEATAQLTALIQEAIDPAAAQAAKDAANDPSAAKSTSQKIKEFFSGITSTATMPAARITDTTTHGGKIIQGAALTLFNGLPAARGTDLQVCPLVEPGPVPHVGGPIREGNPTIFIQSLPAARAGHMVICTPVGLQNPIAAGSANILLGPETAAVLPPPVPVELPSAAAAAAKGAAGSAAGAGGGKGDAKAKEEADAKAKEEADAKAKEEADAKAKEEADAKAKEEADAKAKEEADAKAKEEKAPTNANSEADDPCSPENYKPSQADEDVANKQSRKDVIWGALSTVAPLNGIPLGAPMEAKSLHPAAAEFAKNNGRTPGETNALQHAYWQAMLTQQYGENVAKAIGDQHEKYQMEGDACRQRDSNADLHNNEVARKIGSQPGISEHQIKQDILNAYNSGKLDTSGGQGGSGLGPGKGSGNSPNNRTP